MRDDVTISEDLDKNINAAKDYLQQFKTVYDGALY